jgi:hypothetical protein
MPPREHEMPRDLGRLARTDAALDAVVAGQLDADDEAGAADGADRGDELASSRQRPARSPP